MTARRLWMLYRNRLAVDRRARQISGAAALVLVVAVALEPWVLALVVFYALLGLAVLRVPLVAAFVAPDEDDWA